jgi:hypothetical protein
MIRILFGVFIGMFALLWEVILPNFVSAQDQNRDITTIELLQTQGVDDQYVSTAWYYWDWANPSVVYSWWKCTWWCLKMSSLSETLLYAFLWWFGISLFLYILLIISYFIIYKCKKDPSPLKHALNRTRWLGVMIFILFPVIYIIIFWIVNGSE